MTSYIFEGIDRLGKSTLIDALLTEVGYIQVCHYGKPKKVKKYNDSLEKYQKISFISGFNLLEDQFNPVIFDRFHLGECVYSPLYRNYSGDYVYDLEHVYNANKMDHVKLILLTTSDWSYIEDDGESFDFNRKEEEQELFKEAFNKSKIPNKIMIDINNNGKRKTIDQLLQEIL